MRETMRLESINIGQAETLANNNTEIKTGIRKCPVSKHGGVNVGDLGLQGDTVVDVEHHGGPDQAIYAYSADDYDWWNERSERQYVAGAFGENLTIRGMPSNVNVGDRLLIGEVVLEATAPRIPCKTLSTHLQDKTFGLAFRKAERPGVYCRVLSGGDIHSGSAVTFIASDASDVSIVELFRAYYALSHDAAELRRILAVPLASRFRAKFDAKLAALERL